MPVLLPQLSYKCRIQCFIIPKYPPPPHEQTLSPTMIPALRTPIMAKPSIPSTNATPCPLPLHIQHPPPNIHPNPLFVRPLSLKTPSAQAGRKERHSSHVKSTCLLRLCRRRSESHFNPLISMSSIRSALSERWVCPRLLDVWHEQLAGRWVSKHSVAALSGKRLWRGVGVVPPGLQGWGNSVRGC